MKQRESIKNVALDGLRVKTKGIIEVDDLVIQNLDLYTELEQAIEAKMVQEQEAAKVEADTAVISAKGQAESISIQRDYPGLRARQLCAAAGDDAGSRERHA